MNPLLSEAEQAARDTARSTALERFAGGDAPSLDAIRATVADVLAGDGEVARELRLALAVEETARVNAAAGAAVANACAAQIVLRDLGRDESGPAALVASAGEGEAGTSEAAAGVTQADRFVVVAEDGVWLTASGSAQELELDGLRGAGIGTVTYDGAEKIGDGEAVSSALDLLRLQQAAVAVGIGAAAQDVALAAIAAGKERGERPDRSQAVQWALADIVTETEAARVAVWHAACDDATENAAGIALVLAADGAAAGARRATQIGGLESMSADGAGSRLQRDAKLMELLGGGTDAQLAAIADTLLPDIPRA